MSASVAPFAVQSGEGTRLETPTGDWVTITAHTRNTNGSMSVLEVTSEPKSGPALHIHLREDELWWVLEGEYRFKAGSIGLGSHCALRGGGAFSDPRTIL
jgi:mannose-6-phosphate isomerase-like protein (cupin superfamily)